MAMSALEASKVVDSGNFGNHDLDELYNALSTDNDYSAQLSKIRYQIENRAKSDISTISKAASVADALTKLDAEPLESNPDFAKVRSGLMNVSFSDDLEDSKADYNKVIDRVVAAAKLETMSELRGLSSPESPAVKGFYAAVDDKKRKEIYNEALAKNIELSILTMALGEEVAKSMIALSTEAKNQKDLDKKVDEYKKNISADVAAKLDAVSKFGEKDMPKIEIGENAAIAYCANVEQKVEANLKEYAESIKKISNRIATGFEKTASDSAKALQVEWDNKKAALAQTIDSANKDLHKKAKAFGKECKKVWGKTYEISSVAAKKAWENRYEIAADAAAAAAFGLTVGSGGTAAIVGGIGYGVYTVGRRIVYEAYKAKKQNPEKSYKEIYKDPKFITKSIFSVAAAGVAGTIGITAGLDAAADVAMQKLARRATTVLGSVSSNIVGVINAKDKAERKKELTSLGISSVAGFGGLLLGELFGHSNAGVHKPNLRTEDVAAVSKVAPTPANWNSPFIPKGISDEASEEEIITPYAPGYKPEPEADVSAPADNLPEFEFKDFPSEYNSDMGITKAQFINLRKIILKNGDEAQLTRLYSHASRFAESLTVEGEKTLTAEEVLFKFTRAAAWTTEMDKDFWSQSQTGAFAAELTALKKALDCGDRIDVALLVRAREVLSAVNSNGSLNAEKSFSLVPELSKYNEVNASGEIVGKTDNILVGYGTKNCDPESKNFQFAKGGVVKPRVIPVAEPVAEPVVEPVVEPVAEPVRVAPEPLVAPRLSPIKPVLDVPHPELPKINIVPVQVEVPEESHVAIGAQSNLTERPGREGITALDNLDHNAEPNPMTSAEASASKEMLRDLHKAGKMSDEQYKQALELTKQARKIKSR